MMGDLEKKVEGGDGEELLVKGENLAEDLGLGGEGDFSDFTMGWGDEEEKVEGEVETKVEPEAAAGVPDTAVEGGGDTSKEGETLVEPPKTSQVDEAMAEVARLREEIERERKEREEKAGAEAEAAKAPEPEEPEPHILPEYDFLVPAPVMDRVLNGSPEEATKAVSFLLAAHASHIHRVVEKRVLEKAVALAAEKAKAESLGELRTAAERERQEAVNKAAWTAFSAKYPQLAVRKLLPVLQAVGQEEFATADLSQPEVMDKYAERVVARIQEIAGRVAGGGSAPQGQGGRVEVGKAASYPATVAGTSARGAAGGTAVRGEGDFSDFTM